MTDTESNRAPRPAPALRLAGRIAHAFIESKLTPLVIVAALRYVTLGKPAGENVEVLAGLQGGERLVARTGGLELDGKRVEGGQ